MLSCLQVLKLSMYDANTIQCFILFHSQPLQGGRLDQGILKGEKLTVPLTSCLTDLDYFANKNKNCQLSYS
jgi:hypothetical protein